MIVLTYDEWISIGFYVMKGEKSASRNKEGICIFTRDQVEESNFGYSEAGPDDGDYSSLF